MKNAFSKVSVVVTTVFLAVVGGASIAGATTPTFDPGAEATGLFNSSWPSVLDAVKDMAPLIIGAGLVLAVIGRVVGAFSRGKAPKKVIG